MAKAQDRIALQTYKTDLSSIAELLSFVKTKQPVNVSSDEAMFIGFAALKGTTLKEDTHSRKTLLSWGLICFENETKSTYVVSDLGNEVLSKYDVATGKIFPKDLVRTAIRVLVEWRFTDAGRDIHPGMILLRLLCDKDLGGYITEHEFTNFLVSPHSLSDDDYEVIKKDLLEFRATGAAAISEDVEQSKSWLFLPALESTWGILKHERSFELQRFPDSQYRWLWATSGAPKISTDGAIPKKNWAPKVTEYELTDEAKLVLNKFFNHESNKTSSDSNGSISSLSPIIDPYLAAIRTKPFVLLAGISGTGKSRLVRQLAQGCCPKGHELGKDKDGKEDKAKKPGNFEMIQVRPNWHDSSQLMGYESRVSGKAEFVVKPFVKFLAKAWLYEDEGIPFFLCLDEMNLAPVEQYFAEYLSIIETRRLVGGKVVTDPLVTFPNETLMREAFKEIYQGVDHDKAEKFIKQFIEEKGVSIPQNFIVMGTVNMDETTFSFSRKVLDRAMSFELNEVEMDGGLERNPDYEYGSIDKNSAKCEFTQGYEVYALAKDDCDKIKNFLVEVNKVLDKTPFKIAYRTRNEIMIYCHERRKCGVPLAQALDEVTSMKILSRVEGDKRRLVVRDESLGEYNGKGLLESLLDVILKGLKTVRGGDGEYTESDVCSAKLKEMSGQLENGYTSFWTR